MSKIRVLPDHLANQIAAGEVIERPASVVKELVENSLDAGPSRIEIDIEGGGSKLIRIIDNGCGMEEDDLLMSLERHGTSKISKQEDLKTIGTLGFRGEALPSIASVAKLSLLSRTTGSELGTRVVFEYGKLLNVHDMGCSIGTTVEMRRLFGNTPARRKFLRTNRTEQGHIEEVVKNHALSYPDVSFFLRIDGRESLHLDASMTLAERLARITHYQGEFISFNGLMNKGKELERRLKGYLVPPETVTSGPAKLRLFVNDRAVRDRLMIHAVTAGLRGFLLKGKNPSGLVMLTVNPTEIDVNVHPAKHEIRFRNANDIHTFIVQTVLQTMEEQQRKLQYRIFRPQQETKAEILNSSQNATTTSEISKPSHTKQPQQATPPSSAKTGPSSQPLLQTISASSQQNGARIAEIAEYSPVFTTDKEPPVLHPHNLRIIGVFDDLYIFCQGSEGLVVIDQHAAHERLIYERLRKQYINGKVASQKLMFPETVELSVFQTQLLEKNLEELKRIGFSLRDFGGNTFVISAIPAMAKTIAGKELLLDVLKQFGSEAGNRSNTKGGEILDDILASMACKAAIKANTALSHREIEALLNEMADAEMFSHCPHGRPVTKIFLRDEIKKWFYRT